MNTSASLSQNVVKISKGTEELSIIEQQELSNTGINTTQHVIIAENTSFQTLMEVVKEKQYLDEGTALEYIVLTTGPPGKSHKAVLKVDPKQHAHSVLLQALGSHFSMFLYQP